MSFFNVRHDRDARDCDGPLTSTSEELYVGRDCLMALLGRHLVNFQTVEKHVSLSGDHARYQFYSNTDEGYDSISIDVELTPEVDFKICGCRGCQ